MGFSWSLFFCQRINEGLLRQLPALSHSEVVTDRGPPVVFNAGRQDERHYVYGDNLGFMSGNRSLVEDGVAQLADHFTAFSARIQQDAWRSMKGWRKLSPGRSRKAGLAGLGSDGHRGCAVRPCSHGALSSDGAQQLREAQRRESRNSRCGTSIIPTSRASSTKPPATSS